jgi:hypothetical protein
LNNFIRRGVEYPALGRFNFYANDGGVETSPVQNEKSPQDFFFSNEDTPPNPWFELCGGVLHCWQWACDGEAEGPEKRKRRPTPDGTAGKTRETARRVEFREWAP